TLPDLADDASSAIAFVRAQTSFEYSTIGVMGFSQGGWIAPIVASTNSDVTFVVSMSGPGVTTDEQLLHEVVHTITDLGTYRVVAKLIAPITVSNIQKSEFWGMIGGFDPIPYWRKVSVPVFMAFGENDKNVPVEESVRRIQALNQENMMIKIYPGGGHGIVDPTSRRVQEAFLKDLADFIAQR
ncbi:MAG: dienelactone hydrolase family protein, partial [Ardenticatenales bacterium]|nr:dienelactone hydrolase family protein [Ardenticatenales bacterium]